MANWTDMQRNLQRHGHFAGTKETEQDAYFTFFSGDDGKGAGLMTQITASVIAALSARAALWVEMTSARRQNDAQG